MLFFLTTKRGCAASGVAPDGRRGVAVAIEAWRLRAPSRRVVRPSGSPRIPATKAPFGRHENVQASRRWHENSSSSIERTNWREDVSSRAHRAFLEPQVNNHGVRFQTKRVVTPPKSKVLVACLRLVAKRLVRRFHSSTASLDEATKCFARRFYSPTGSFDKATKCFREIDGRLERFRVAKRFRDERTGKTRRVGADAVVAAKAARL